MSIDAGASAQAQHRALRRRERLRSAAGAIVLLATLGWAAAVVWPVDADAGRPLSRLNVVVPMAISLGLGLWLRRAGTADRWRIGAEGEQQTATLLDQLGGGAIVLHDRRLPRSHANLDHVVITRRGVTVVETKRFAGTVKVGRRSIAHNGRPKPELVAQAAHQRNVVDQVVCDHTQSRARPGHDHDRVAVRSVIVVHGATVRRRLLGRRAVDGIEVVAASELRRRIQRGRRHLSRRRMRALATVLDAALPPASR